MRKLKTADIFAALRLVKTAGIREGIKPVLRLAAEGKVSVEDVGIESILSLVEAFAGENAEQAFYTFLAGPFELDAAAIGSLELMELADKLKRLAEENDLTAFFGCVSDILGKR